MSKTKFTSGPWRVAGTSTIKAGEHDWIGNISMFNRTANALLIAAAPDLYVALEEIMGAVEDWSGTQHVLTQAHAALAKARGET